MAGLPQLALFLLCLMPKPTLVLQPKSFVDAEAAMSTPSQPVKVGSEEFSREDLWALSLTQRSAQLGPTGVVRRRQKTEHRCGDGNGALLGDYTTIGASYSLS